MKKELKGFVCGVVASTVLIAGAGFAAGQWKTIDVLEDDIAVVVDGKRISESNFVYNDKTYLPLRAVAEAVNKPVSYDETTNTAYIGDIPTVSKFSEVGPYQGMLYIYVYQDISGTKYVRLSDISKVTAYSGIYTSILPRTDGTWVFSEWNDSTGQFEDKTTGGYIFDENEKEWYVLLSDFETKIRPILDKYAKTYLQ